MDVREGELLLGKFRVERKLGTGGMGVVVSAWHVQLGTRVALKLLQPRMVEDPTASSRFLREAQAAAQLRGAHVARVTDVGMLESGAPYMVMEYLEGRDLGAILHERGPLDPADAAEYIAQACEALAEAHALGIVHRDIKPSNLFLARDTEGRPSIKVLDFGVSKLVEASGQQPAGDLRMTDTFALLGSPVYMAPEQMRAARNADARSDLWSVGVTLYELVTGHLPFEASSMIDLALKVANDPVPPPREHRPDLPPPLEAVILRCLEKDPAGRWPGARQLRDALRGLRLSPGKVHAIQVDTPGPLSMAMRATAPSDPSASVSARPAKRVSRQEAETLANVPESAASMPSETQAPWSTRSQPRGARPAGARRAIAAVAAVVVVAAGGALVLSRALGRGGAPDVAPSPASELVSPATESATASAPAPSSAPPEPPTQASPSTPPASAPAPPATSAAPSSRAPGTGRLPAAAATPKGAPPPAAGKAPSQPRDPFADPN